MCEGFGRKKSSAYGVFIVCTLHAGFCVPKCATHEDLCSLCSHLMRSARTIPAAWRVCCKRSKNEGPGGASSVRLVVLELDFRAHARCPIPNGTSMLGILYGPPEHNQEHAFVGHAQAHVVGALCMWDHIYNQGAQTGSTARADLRR